MRGETLSQHQEVRCSQIPAKGWPFINGKLPQHYLIRTWSWASLQLSREQGLSDSEAAVELLFSAVRTRETFTLKETVNWVQVILHLKNIKTFTFCRSA